MWKPANELKLRGVICISGQQGEIFLNGVRNLTQTEQYKQSTIQLKCALNKNASVI